MNQKMFDIYLHIATIIPNQLPPPRSGLLEQSAVPDRELPR